MSHAPDHRRGDRAGTVTGVRRSPYLRWLLLMGPCFVAFWLLLSGHFEMLFLALGAASVALVCWLCARAGVTREVDLPGRLLLRLPRYFLWLGAQVLVSAVAVVRRVWTPRTKLSPAVAAVSTAELSELSQVVYANSITFTPGTLALELTDDHIEVHSLERAGAVQLQGGAMHDRVRALEGQR